MREATVEVPHAARSVVVSLDGVMAPMRSGYIEAGCATVSLVDREGQRLHSVRMDRMPESNKTTLKTMVAAEVEAVLAKRPDLTVVKLADGAKDNWTFLTGALPEGVELIDFYHLEIEAQPERLSVMFVTGVVAAPGTGFQVSVPMRLLLSPSGILAAHRWPAP